MFEDYENTKRHFKRRMNNSGNDGSTFSTRTDKNVATVFKKEKGKVFFNKVLPEDAASKFSNEFIIELTENEKQSIKTLNFIATFDGVIESEDNIKYLLNEGIKKFIAPKRQHLVLITETAYPIRIKYKKNNIYNEDVDITANIKTDNIKDVKKFFKDVKQLYRKISSFDEFEDKEDNTKTGREFDEDNKDELIVQDVQNVDELKY